MKIKIFPTLASVGASIALVTSSAHSALLVYEGFDYTAAAAVDSQNGGIGWGGAWSTSGTSANQHTVGTGLTFGTVPVVGGAAQRDPRNGRSAGERTISGASQALLTTDNSTVWFSVLMDPRVEGGNGFENNTRGTLVFGDTGLTDASGSGPGLLPGGNAFGVAFAGSNGGVVDNAGFSNSAILGVSYSGGTVTTTSAITVMDTVSMIVGRIDWAATGSDDTLTLYDIQDPNAALPASFASITADLDQSTFNVVSIAEGQTSVFDEIRFGEELADVGVIPEPSAAALIGLSALACLRRRRR